METTIYFGQYWHGHTYNYCSLNALRTINTRCQRLVRTTPLDKNIVSEYSG